MTILMKSMQYQVSGVYEGIPSRSSIAFVWSYLCICHLVKVLTVTATDKVSELSDSENNINKHLNTK